jgi:hypothetical protein
MLCCIIMSDERVQSQPVRSSLQYRISASSPLPCCSPRTALLFRLIGRFLLVPELCVLSLPNPPPDFPFSCRRAPLFPISSSEVWQETISGNIITSKGQSVAGPWNASPSTVLFYYHRRTFAVRSCNWLLLGVGKADRVDASNTASPGQLHLSPPPKLPGHSNTPVLIDMREGSSKKSSSESLLVQRGRCLVRLVSKKMRPWEVSSATTLQQEQLRIGEPYHRGVLFFRAETVTMGFDRCG